MVRGCLGPPDFCCRSLTIDHTKAVAAKIGGSEAARRHCSASNMLKILFRQPLEAEEENLGALTPRILVVGSRRPSPRGLWPVRSAIEGGLRLHLVPKALGQRKKKCARKNFPCTHGRGSGSISVFPARLARAGEM